MREEVIYRDRPHCLRPDCYNYGILRGLCRPCYKAADRLVDEGKATWEKLERKGLALPSKGVGRQPSAARSFFLEECK